MLLLIPKVAFDDKAAEHAILGWLSWKRARVAKSSLNAETQAAAEASGSLEYAETFWNLLHQPEQPVLSPSLRTTGPSVSRVIRSACTMRSRRTRRSRARCAVAPPWSFWSSNRLYDTRMAYYGGCPASGRWRTG